MESLGHEGCPHIKDGPATRVNKWSTAYGMRIQKEAISNEKLSSFDADDEPQPGNGRQWSKGREREAARNGQLFISLCYNKYHRKPTVWPTVALHTKDRILNSMLESVSWHSLATVAPAEWPSAGSVQSVQYAVSSIQCRVAASATWPMSM